MSKHPAGTITANGVSVEIFVNDDGEWEADYAGRTLRFPVREKLEAAIKRVTKTTTTPVEIPFVRIERRGERGITTTRGTATGIHSGNGNVLVVWHLGIDGDQKDQTKSAGGYGERALDLGDVSDDVLAEFRALVIARAKAVVAEQEFASKHKINLKDAVLNAIAEAAGNAE